MKKVTLSLLIILASPLNAIAAGLETLTYPAINVTLYFCLILFIYKSFISKLIRQRAVEIKDKLQQTARALDAAKQELEVEKARILEIDDEKEQISKQYEQEALSMSQAIIDAAKKSAAQKDKDTELQVERELGAAQKVLRQKIAKNAAAQVRSRFQNELSDAKDQELRKEVVSNFLQAGKA